MLRERLVRVHALDGVQAVLLQVLVDQVAEHQLPLRDGLRILTDNVRVRLQSLLDGLDELARDREDLLVEC